MPTAVLPDLMLVFGGRSADSSLSGDVYMLNTNASLRRAVSASSLLAVDTEEFSLSAHDWKGSLGGPSSPGPLGVCGDVGAVLGGPGVLAAGGTVSKLYLIPSPHTAVRVQVTVATMDAWVGDSIALVADGAVVWNRTVFASRGPSRCGDPAYGDELITADRTVAHTARFLSLALTSTRARNTSASGGPLPAGAGGWWGLARVTLTVLPAGHVWAKVPPAGTPPGPRVHHAAALFEGTMFVFGGSSAAPTGAVEADRALFDGSRAGAVLADCFAFNTSAGTWAVVNASGPGPAARSHHSLTGGLGDGLVLYGGQAADGLFLSDVHVLLARTREWLRPVVLGEGPGPRAGHGAATLEGRLWVFGGFRMARSSRNIRAAPDGLHYLDLASLVWHRPAGPAPPPQARYGHALLALVRPAAQLVVVGGAVGDAGQVSLLADAHVLQPSCAPAVRERGPAKADRGPAVMGCAGVGAADAARDAAEKLRDAAAEEVAGLGRRLGSARMAVALRREQHATDAAYHDGVVEGYVTAVHGLIAQGAVYQTRLNDLARARRDRLETEQRYVTSMDALDGARRALEARIAEVRRTADAAVAELDRRGAVLARARAEAAVGAGAHHSCAVSEGGRAVCWGLDDAGQASPPDDVLLAVAAGDHFTCGIRAADGALRCWGSASFGKTTPPGRGPYAQVSLGGSSACAVARNGSLRCFGDGRSAQTDPPHGTYIAVSVGTAHACALRAPPASPQQRGGAADGVGEVVCWGSHADRRAAAPPGRFKSVCAGGRHSCAVAAVTGRVVCWGSDSNGQLRAPPEVMTSVTCGHAHTCGIKVNGAAVCWGRNVEKQAGPPVLRFKAVSAGWTHTCGVEANRGRVVCWGSTRSQAHSQVLSQATSAMDGSSRDTTTCRRVWV